MLKLGDATIMRIEELVLHEAPGLFADWDPALADRYKDWMGPDYYDPATGSFVASIHSWLVRTPRQLILIDTGAGNNKTRPASPRFDHLDTPYLRRLREAGAAPEQVDMVVCTHLHIDHVGWNTRQAGSGWVPSFPNATYVFPRLECQVRDPARGAAARPPATWHPFQDSVQPVLDAGMARLVDGNESLAEGIDLMPVPGHAPGQMAVRLRSGGQEALFVADVLHQPIQVYHPDWNSKYCEDPALARQTRRMVLEHCADHGCLMLPGHFGAPHCGYVRRTEAGFAFVPVDGQP